MMDIRQAFTLLDGIDGAAVLTRTALGQLVEAARDFAGVWSDHFDEIIANHVGASDDASLGDLVNALDLLAPFYPALKEQLHGKCGPWRKAASDPLPALQAKVLFSLVMNQQPDLMVDSVLIDGAPLVNGGNIPAGSTLSVRGRGFGLDGLTYVRLSLRTKSNDVWDFKALPTTGRELVVDVPIPEPASAMVVEVRVMRGLIVKSTMAWEGDDPETGPQRGQVESYGPAGPWGVIVGGI